MPYKSEKLKMPRQYDARVKLTDKDRREIIDLHKSGWPIRKIARHFIGQASRRLIMFIIYPERQAANLKRRRELLAINPQRYYNREKHNQAMKKHRHRKQKLYLAGKIARHFIGQSTPRQK
jgi:hypothetical protein